MLCVGGDSNVASQGQKPMSSNFQDDDNDDIILGRGALFLLLVNERCGYKLSPFFPPSLKWSIKWDLKRKFMMLLPRLSMSVLPVTRSPTGKNTQYEQFTIKAELTSQDNFMLPLPPMNQCKLHFILIGLPNSCTIRALGFLQFACKCIYTNNKTFLF